MIHELTDDETVRRMLRRERDVTRQILLLLYVATEGIPKDIYSESEDYFDEDLTPSQAMEEYAAKIDTMLYECGFGKLDPRNKFDWLILYSLRINLDDYDGMLDRLKSVFEEIERRTEEIAEPLSN